MSASEKLKALEDVKAIDWPTSDHQTYRDNENALRRRDIALVRALPQIVAVVEAAEKTRGLRGSPGPPGMMFVSACEPAVPDTITQLLGALTDLDEALA